MDEMIVKLNIEERDIAHIKKGQKAQIMFDAYPDEIFSGEVSQVSEMVDVQTRTLPIEITIANNDRRLKSGMFCRIKLFTFKHNDVLIVSQDALVQELGGVYVFTVKEGAAYKKQVKTGIRDDGHVEILEGITKDDLLIVFGQQGLKDGTQVEIEKLTDEGR
jgi:membrane fusion protein (multidrug efflux system)